MTEPGFSLRQLWSRDSSAHLFSLSILRHTRLRLGHKGARDERACRVTFISMITLSEMLRNYAGHLYDNICCAKTDSSGRALIDVKFFV